MSFLCKFHFLPAQFEANITGFLTVQSRHRYSLSIMTRKNKPFRKLRHKLTAPAVRIAVFLCACTPRPLLGFYARVLGFVLSISPLSANGIIEKHRKTVMAENGILASNASVYASVLRGYFDFFYLSKRSDEIFRRAVKVKGAENMARALEQGKGAIAVTGHFSAWELIPRAVKLQGFETGVVGRSLTHSGASAVLEKLRAAPGIHVVDRDAGVGPIVRLFRRNTAMGILIDQDTSRVQSEIADFLGFPARTPVAPAMLAQRLGVPVVPLHIVRLPNSNYLLQIDEPLCFSKEDSQADILNLLNRRIGEWIKSAPKQWVWFHRRWKGTGLP